MLSSEILRKVFVPEANGKLDVLEGAQAINLLETLKNFPDFNMSTSAESNSITVKFEGKTCT